MIQKTSKKPEKPWFQDQPFWEKGYGNMQVSTMGGSNHDVIELAAGLSPGTKVLDLGCGEGRNSLYLAGKGCQVTAVDLSESALKKLDYLAQKAGVDIKTIVADIREFKINEPYDLIMAHGVIDYLERDEWKKLLNQIKQMTAPGGYNAYTCMMFNEQYPTPQEFKAAKFKHCLKVNELGKFYNDWDKIRYEYYVKWDQHPGIPIHCHPLEKLLAKKPGEKNKRPVISFVPIGNKNLDQKTFDAIYMGMQETELLLLCGEPDVIDHYSAQGIQFGVGHDISFDGYHLALWFYGSSWIYVINKIVWGKSIAIRGKPIRVRFFSDNLLY